ncbi:hypothetical protein A3L09_02390 [Thermococcus profundus]|uniref:Uncharacterized protein n=2 Tax=Thermococcus profundus TaxID=49899 RepID=A0A2Z2MG40_THEPR|nr:hypothetical protein A3L09_02390 [Thermococcus profundus]
MNPLEFCVKSLSYPLGMVLEGLSQGKGDVVEVRNGRITLPEVPFAAKCYLTAKAIYMSLDPVDAKRVSDDLQGINDFAERILSSKLGPLVEEYFKRGHELIKRRETVGIDWLEYERRKEKVKPYFEALLTGKEPEGLENLTVDECLLISYLARERKLKERVNAVLGKHNSGFRKAVVEYFKALRG